MDRQSKRVLDIIAKNGAVTEEDFLIQVEKTSLLMNIVDEYIPLDRKNVLFNENSLVLLEEQILEEFHRLTNDIRNPEITGRLFYLCSQQLIIEKYRM